MDEDLERLKQHLPLLEYLQRHNWSGRRAGAQQEFVGLCPLHRETHPSFYVNARKNLFYCHGCARGGDLIRFVEFFHDLSFHQSVAYLKQELASVARAASVSELLAQAAVFYQLELHRRPEAVHYLSATSLASSWSRGCSTSECCGRPAFAIPLVLSVHISPPARSRSFVSHRLVVFTLLLITTGIKPASTPPSNWRSAWKELT